MSAEIYKAIAKAMGSVKTIAKSAHNTHDKYNFASVDDFLAALNPICAESGLFVIMNEIECEGFTRQGKYSETAWLRLVFEFTVAHTSGETLSPVRRTVEVIRSGAQSYGSAQSYALKQFLRALLMVPTGDKEDADYGEKGEGVIKRDDNRDAVIAREAKENTDAAQLIHEIGECQSIDEIGSLWTAANRDHRKVLLTRRDVADAKDKAKARVAEPDPFAQAAQ